MEAFKLRGILQFVAAGAYGRIGFCGMQPRIMGQYVDGSLFRASSPLRAILIFFQAMNLQLRRGCRLWASLQPPLIIASHRRLRDSPPASVVTLTVDPGDGSGELG